MREGRNRKQAERPSRAPSPPAEPVSDDTALADYQNLMYGQFSEFMSFDDFAELTCGDGVASDPVGDAVLAAGLANNPKRLRSVLTTLRDEMTPLSFREAINSLGPARRDASDRLNDIAYQYAWTHLRLVGTGKRYRDFGAKAQRLPDSLAIELSRAIDRVLVYAADLGLTTDRERLVFLCRVVDQITHNTEVGGYGEAAERRSIVAVNQFRRVLAKYGIKSDADYLTLMDKWEDHVRDQ